MKLRYLSTTIAVLALVVTSIAPAAQVSAQTPAGSGQALEIGPPVMNLSANPGETIKATISLRDISPTSLVVTGQVNDFIAGGEDGTPKILLEETDVSPYSFKAWVDPLAQLTLKSKQVKNLPITIRVPADASPGGYYGVVRFTSKPPELEGTGVALSASLGALILLTVKGQAKEGLSVVEFSASHNGKTGTLFEAAPIVFTERFKNTGNIHEQPTGLVTIKDMFGNVLATLGVNQPPRDILPQSIRKFESSLDSTNIGNKFLFGLYHAELSVTYGSSKQVVTSSLDFWVIPYTLIGIGIIVLVGGFFILRFAVRRYNQSIIDRAQRAKKQTKRKK
jgi:hypothetical protein